ncbi:MAG: SdpI family protein [Oscillospiraceae bacterium]|nr:SdpI family protein [Oscillospiraceae bacterium]
MWKNHKKLIILTSLLTLLPIAAGLLLWNKLPAQIAIHFAADGTPDNWASKLVAVVGLPLLVTALHLLCIAMTAIDPKHKNHDARQLTLMLWICPMVSALVSVLMLGNALGKVDTTSVPFFVTVFLGVLFVIIGNYMPKFRHNYTIGIKLPWTLHSEENWNYTHRVGGFSFSIGGVLVLFTSFIGTPWIVLGILIAMIAIPVIASAMYHYKHK